MTFTDESFTTTADLDDISQVTGMPKNALDPQYSPRLHSLLSTAGEVSATLLESRRPGTLSTKISRVSGPYEQAALLVASRVAASIACGATSVKWEDSANVWSALAHDLGFVRLSAPAVSGPGTTAPVSAWVHYTTPWPHVGTPYYRQTTDFSCGPASLLMAEAAQLGPTSMTRARERDIWRSATRFTGCGVWGLTLQANRDLFTVHTYDTEFLTEQVTPMEPAAARAFANEEDRRRVQDAGIHISERVCELSEVAAAIDAGARVLVLINEARFHGEDIPHWVVAHAHRDGIILLNDPWVESDHGETWVDAVDIPVSIAELEKLAWWGEPQYRSVLVVQDR